MRAFVRFPSQPKGYIRASRIYADEEQKKDVEESFEDLLKKLQGISNYSQFVNTLKQLNDNQKKLFMENFGEVQAIKPQVSEGGIDVEALLPTQSEIDWKKSLSYGLGQDCSYFFKSPVTLGMPVLTYKGKYIIDGHHRWSQVYMFNPKGQVSCTNFNYDSDGPIDVLKDFQASVLAENGEVKVGTAGTNIWTVDEGTLRDFIDSNMKDACWKSLVKAGVAEDRDSAIDYIVGNAMQLQKKVKPIAGAPDRVDMPQTDPAVIKRAAKSLTDMSASTNLGGRQGPRSFTVHPKSRVQASQTVQTTRKFTKYPSRCRK